MNVKHGMVLALGLAFGGSFVPLRASPFFPWSSAGDVLGS